jgi:hypothetical protein
MLEYQRDQLDGYELLFGLWLGLHGYGSENVSPKSDFVMVDLRKGIKAYDAVQLDRSKLAQYLRRYTTPVSTKTRR